MTVLLNRDFSTLTYVEGIFHLRSASDQKQHPAPLHCPKKLVLHSRNTRDIKNDSESEIGNLVLPALPSDVNHFFGGPNCPGDFKAVGVYVAQRDPGPMIAAIWVAI